VNVRSAAKDGGYKLMSGTSMAAPFVAGLVALCRQYNPDATVEEIKSAIINSAQDLARLVKTTRTATVFPMRRACSTSFPIQRLLDSG